MDGAPVDGAAVVVVGGEDGSGRDGSGQAAHALDRRAGRLIESPSAGFPPAR